MNLDFQVDFSKTRQSIIGAKHLQLVLDIHPENLIDDTGVPFTLLPKAVEKMPLETMAVQFPEDILAKREAKERLSGSNVHSSLHTVLHNVHAL
jgi:hypothetical protein